MKFDVKSFFAGSIIATFTIIGCAGTPTFPWNYYATQMPSQCYREGALLGKAGPDGWPDIPLTTCEPDPIPAPLPSGASPGPSPILLKCMTVKADDFYSIKQDDIDCHSNLQAAQAELAQCKNALRYQ